MTASVKRLALALGSGLLAITVGASAYVHAQDHNTDAGQPPFRGRGMGLGGPGRGAGGPMGMLPMLGRLGLSDAQRDQLKTIAAAHADEWKTLAARGRTAHMALDDAISADTVDEASIRQKAAEAAAVDADVAVARAHARAEALQILTADQKSQLKTMQAKMQQRMAAHQNGERPRR
jgi:Spy/CpxP family protein refolding chaperone